MVVVALQLCGDIRRRVPGSAPTPIPAPNQSRVTNGYSQFYKRINIEWSEECLGTFDRGNKDTKIDVQRGRIEEDMQATVASVTSPAFFVSPVKLLRSRRYLELQRCSLFLHSHNRQLSLTCSVKVSAENWFSERSKFKTHINKLTEKIWEARPQAAKEFPWKKAKDLVVQRILFLGEKALKWLLITLFVISSLSDVVFSISRNRELIIPVGLFIGTAMANFLKETTQEMFQNTKEGELVRQLVGISIFFVLIKFISQYLTLSGRVFLSHISNGGLMQVLWLGKKLQDAKDAENGQTPSSNLDASITDNLETEI